MKNLLKKHWGSKVALKPAAPSEKNPLNPIKIVRKNKGQVVIEYVLLMVILASLGAVIMRSFVSRNTDEPGILVDKWDRLLKAVAEDNPED